MDEQRDTTDRFLPRFDAAGLVTAIVVDSDTQALLMVAHMNEAAIEATRTTGQAHFWSRSRAALWRKGESSGQVQHLVELLVDCDGDTLLLRVDQTGVACHTGRRSCFFRAMRDQGLETVAEVVVPPERLYGA